MKVLVLLLLLSSHSMLSGQPCSFKKSHHLEQTLGFSPHWAGGLTWHSWRIKVLKLCNVDWDLNLQSLNLVSGLNGAACPFFSSVLDVSTDKEIVRKVVGLIYL